MEEIFEARVPKGQAVIAEMDGDIEVLHEEEAIFLRLTNASVVRQEVDIPPGYKAKVVSKKEVVKGAVIAEAVATDGKEAEGKPILAEFDGVTKVTKKKIVVSSEATDSLEYPISHSARLHVKNGDVVVKGQQLTEGSLNPHDVIRIRGVINLQRYLLNEIQSTYRVVGVAVSDKHVEIVIRQMLRKVRVEESGDTDLLPDELIDKMRFAAINESAVSAGSEPAVGVPVLLGVTKASLNTESFLAAASFQDTTRVLTEAALQGSTDRLRGLKENVIIGKLIPAGTGKAVGRFALVSAFEAAGEALDDLDVTEDGDGEIAGDGNGEAAAKADSKKKSNGEAEAGDEGKAAKVAADDRGEKSEVDADPAAE